MADLLFDPVPDEIARAFINRRLPMKRALFDALLPELQGQAFTVSGIESLDALQEILTLVSDVPAGEDFAKTQKKVLGVLLEHIPPPREAEPALFADFTAEELAEHAAKLATRAKFITRTLTTQAYAHTAWRDLEEAGDALPYWQYLTVGDGNVRQSHRALEGVILPRNHPFWQTHFPPWEPGCRCQTVGVPGPEVEEMREAEAGKPEEERLVLTPAQIARIEREGSLRRRIDGVLLDVDVRPPSERHEGKAWSFDPSGLAPDLRALRKRYDPDIFATWKRWAKQTPADPRESKGKTVWDWALAAQKKQAKDHPA